VVSIKADCDNDTLLIQADPAGPVCHTGTDTCWGEKNEEPVMFLKALQDFIDKRHEEMRKLPLSSPFVQRRFLVRLKKVTFPVSTVLS